MKNAVWLRWLERGVAVGGLLGSVECVVTAASGRNLPVSYLLGIAAIDLIAGVGIGIVGLALAHLLHRGRDETFPGVFVPLATATGFVYLLDKSLVAAAFHDVPRSLGVGLLVAATLAFAAAAHRLARGRSLRGPGNETAVALGSLLVVIFLVGGRHLTRSVFVSYLRADALLVNSVLGIATIVAVVAQHRFLVSRAPRVSPLNLVLATITVSGLVTGLAVWRTRPKPLTLPIPMPTSSAPDSRPNVILISIDTLRADRLSCYGYPRQTTPNLDRLASEGVLFRNAISPGNWTGPGHASMLTGTMPTTHGLWQLEHPTLRRDIPTLAELLAAAGYRTGGVVSNGTALSRRNGFDRGFRFYDDRMKRAFGYEPLLSGPLEWFPLPFGRVTKQHRGADDVNGTALSWVDRNRGAPLFLFLNYMEPHDPYAPPASFEDRFPGRRSFVLSAPAWDLFRALRDTTPEEDAHYRALYDGEVAYVDHCVGQLLDALKRLGVYDRSLVIVTSDHGEFFGEHRLWGHAVGPYQPVHHIPLILKFPGVGARDIDSDWVSLIDVVPTILEAVGLPVPPSVQGRTLKRGPRSVAIENAAHIRLTRQFGSRFSRTYRGLYDGTWKLLSYNDGAIELFDVRADPEERHDLAAIRPDEVRRMKGRLDAYWAGLPVARQRQDDGDEGRRLRALGYVE